MSARPLRTFWWALIVFVPLLTLALAGMAGLGMLTARRRRERGAAAWPAEPASAAP
jgi:hypothetical protein